MKQKYVPLWNLFWLLQMWNDFINRSEEDQEILLHSSSQQKQEPFKDNDGEPVAPETEAIGDGWEDLGDKRSGIVYTF